MTSSHLLFFLGCRVKQQLMIKPFSAAQHFIDYYIYLTHPRVFHPISAVKKVCNVPVIFIVLVLGYSFIGDQQCLQYFRYTY